jgi:hypothetical protein
MELGQEEFWGKEKQKQVRRGVNRKQDEFQLIRTKVELNSIFTW